MKYKILYTADIHGNEIQYEKLVNYALQVNAKSVIIGGDILPKNLPVENFIQGQKKFIKNNMRKIFSFLKDKIPVYLIMGNDDCAINMPALEESKDLYNVIHNKRLSLTEDFDIVGYSFVPITPFGIKDWEKFDFNNPPLDLLSKYKHRKITNYRLDGVKSTEKGWEYFSFSVKDELKNSIQKDLAQELFTKNPERTVYVIHSPPDNTNLDIVMNGNHVGSMALRRFIEQHQPYLTLHGHVHETVHKSGTFKQLIKNSLSMSPGNHEEGKDLAVLVFDLYDLKSVERKIL